MKKNNKFKNYSIKKKLLISHGSIIALSAIIIIALLVGMEVIKNKLDGLYNGPTTNTMAIGEIRYSLTDIQRALNRNMADKSTDRADAYKRMEATINKDVEALLAAADTLEQHLLTEESKALLHEMLQTIDEGETIRPQVMALLKAGKMDEANELNFNTYLPLVDSVKAIANQLDEQIKNVGYTYYSDSEKISVMFIIGGIAALVFGVFVAMAIALKITIMIVKPINEVTEAAERMHEGDMSASSLITYEAEDEVGIVAASLKGAMEILASYIDEISSNLREIAKGDLTKDSDEITDFRGDFASIKESFVYILKRFNSTLTEIHHSSDLVAGSSKEIAQSSQMLSEGATDQASAIEELTATVATVAGLAEESARNTQEAYENIKRSTDKAEEEKQKMEELTEEMKRIMEISKEIENIITAIEDIASQTNLLSLNASIEAARAGEAGKGFAVVADQIGKLAADSAQSAVNTRELIGKTLEEIEKGNAITLSTSVAFEKVIEEMKAFANVAQTTNETAKEQAHALEQVEHGIDQISTVMQSTAAAAQECTAISEELSNEAVDLDTEIKKFKLYE